MNFMVFFLKQPLSNSPQNPRTKPGCFPGHHQQKLPSHQCMCSTIFGINWGRGVSTRTVDGGLDQRSRVVFTVSSTSSAWWLNVSTPLEKICTCKLKIGNHFPNFRGENTKKNLWNHHLMRILSLKLTANAPWNMTIGIDTRFLLGPGPFSRAIAVSFRECKICLNLIYDRSITSFHPIIPYLWICLQHCVLSRGALTNNSPSYSCCLFLRLRLKTLLWKMYRLRKIIFWSQICGTILLISKELHLPLATQPFQHFCYLISWRSFSKIKKGGGFV